MIEGELICWIQIQVVYCQVEEERIQDAAAGMEVAKALDGFIRRKV